MGSVFAWLVAGSVVAMQFFARYVCTYRVSSDELQVVLFRAIPAYGVVLANIRNIAEVPYSETLKPRLSALRFGNRIFGRVVVVEKKAGLFKTMFITPDDPEAFVAEVRAKMAGLPTP
jgi:hypothetical protein